MLARLAILVVAAMAVAPQASAQQPGTVPPNFAAGEDPPTPPSVGSGLKAFYREFDKLRLSVDAAGAINGPSTVQADKPTGGATVDKAYLLASSYGRLGLGNGALSLDGVDVTWMASDVASAFGFPTYFNMTLADVTGIVKDKINRASAGKIGFRVDENFFETVDQGIDGAILAVVFKVPSDAKKRNVTLLFGGVPASGDAFEVALDKPIDKDAPGARAEMGVGISFSYQNDGAQQFTRLDVNGRRLTSAAGGQDDGDVGATTNGAIITVGGLGDSSKNPSNPNATPQNPQSDDERYSLLPFLGKSARSINIRATNSTDDNNLFFAWLDLSVEGSDADQDTDGDGLRDAWERDGYDHDGDGKVDVDLPKLGAKVRKKDLFVAYAWMRAGAREKESHRPDAKVLDAVKQAFARAPVQNPDGSTGITLHWKDLGDVAHDDDLDPVWQEFDKIMDPRVSPAQRRIYHRMLNGHAYSGTDSSGLSRDIPASDFVETLGRFATNPGTLVERAGTIMHEFGHNLGLKHGAIDDINFKPNHLSIMSYSNQLEWLIRDGKPFLDYDRFDLSDLNEANLNENIGLDAAGPSKDQLGKYGVRWFSAGFLNEKKSGADGRVDWDRDGKIEGSTATDINDDRFFDALRTRFVEWDNIIFDGGQIGAAGDGPPSPRRRSLVTSPSDLKELTSDEYERMKRMRRVVE